MAWSAADLAPGWFLLPVKEGECPGRGQDHSGRQGEVGAALRSWAVAAAFAARTARVGGYEGWACQVCGYHVILEDGDVRPAGKRGARR